MSLYFSNKKTIDHIILLLIFGFYNSLNLFTENFFVPHVKDNWRYVLVSLMHLILLLHYYIYFIM